MTFVNQVQIPPGRGPGHWVRVLVDELTDHPRWSAVVWCPVCGRPMGVVAHQIAEDGTISPSLGHPTHYPPCAWHTYPQLLGWAPLPPLPAVRPIETCEGCQTQSRSVSGWSTWSNGRGLICPACAESRRLAR